MFILGAVDSGSSKWLRLDRHAHNEEARRLPTLWWLQKTVCERESDETGQREDKVWEKLTLFVEIS